MTASSASMDDEGAAGTLSAAQRYLTLATVVLGSSLYGTALLTTSTILPQMQGAMSATQDEIAWVMTFNILATAVVTPMTGWFVSRFGTKRVVVFSIGLFTVATLLCGMAQSLEMLVLWRIVQGGAGAPVVPLSQSILFDTFPRRQHTHGDVDLRHGGRGRAGVRPDHRRLFRRDVQLALVVLHAGADRRLRHDRHELDLAGRRAAREASLRLDRLPRAGHRAGRRATRARARPAAGLVQFDGDRRSSA